MRATRQGVRRAENHGIGSLKPGQYFNAAAVVMPRRYCHQLGSPIPNHAYLQALLPEQKSTRWNHNRGNICGQLEMDLDIRSWHELAIWIIHIDLYQQSARGII